MKTYVCAGYNLMAFDEETKQIEELKDQHLSSLIDYMYIAPADGLVLSADKPLDVKEGDVILKLYSNDGKPQVMVLPKENEFGAYCLAYNKERNCKNTVCRGESVLCKTETNA